MSNVILFGAGASYGSNNRDVPPLGDDLFLALQRFNPPGWGSLPSSIAQEFQGDFEKGMTKLSQIHSHAMPVLQRAMAAFFFNFMPTENNLYHILAKRIKESDWQGAITTLNYDRLLEISLIHEGIQPVVRSEAKSKKQLELCLPHGCCHLFCEGVKASANGVSFSGVGVSFDGDIKLISNPQEHNYRINNDAVPPVMSYFEPQKNTSAGVSFIKGQRERWSQLVSQSKVIAAIGIKIRERDSHICNPLKNTPGRIVYCGGNTGGQEFAVWHEKYRPGKDHMICQGYFADEFDSLCNELGIGA